MFKAPTRRNRLARLESNKKMGYYPTPPKTLKHICEWIRFQYSSNKERSYNVLDPCAGTGEALAELIYKNIHTLINAYGIELDMDRAVEAQKRFIAVQGSLYNARVNPLCCMGLLYLNPPYDTLDGERTEMMFLKHAIKWLDTNGVLVFIVPEQILDKRNREWIGQHFYNITICRICKEEFDRFRQVVLMGYKNFKRLERGEIIPGPPYGYIDAFPSFSPKMYEVPTTCGPKVFQGTMAVTEEDVVKYRPMAISAIAKELGKVLTVTKMEPVLPPRKGHLVSLITGGMVDSLIPARTQYENDLVVKGYSERIETTTIDEDAGKEITRETFATGIRVIEITTEGGIWYDVK